MITQSGLIPDSVGRRPDSLATTLLVQHVFGATGLETFRTPPIYRNGLAPNYCFLVRLLQNVQGSIPVDYT